METCLLFFEVAAGFCGDSVYYPMIRIVLPLLRKDQGSKWVVGVCSEKFSMCLFLYILTKSLPLGGIQLASIYFVSECFLGVSMFSVSL